MAKTAMAPSYSAEVLYLCLKKLVSYIYNTTKINIKRIYNVY